MYRISSSSDRESRSELIHPSRTHRSDVCREESPSRFHATPVSLPPTYPSFGSVARSRSESPRPSRLEDGPVPSPERHSTEILRKELVQTRAHLAEIVDEYKHAENELAERDREMFVLRERLRLLEGETDRSSRRTSMESSYIPGLPNSSPTSPSSVVSFSSSVSSTRSDMNRSLTVVPSVELPLSTVEAQRHSIQEELRKLRSTPYEILPLKTSLGSRPLQLDIQKQKIKDQISVLENKLEEEKRFKKSPSSSQGADKNSHYVDIDVKSLPEAREEIDRLRIENSTLFDAINDLQSSHEDLRRKWINASQQIEILEPSSRLVVEHEQQMMELVQQLQSLETEHKGCLEMNHRLECALSEAVRSSEDLRQDRDVAKVHARSTEENLRQLIADLEARLFGCEERSQMLKEQIQVLVTHFISSLHCTKDILPLLHSSESLASSLSQVDQSVNDSRSAVDGHSHLDRVQQVLSAFESKYDVLFASGSACNISSEALDGNMLNSPEKSNVEDRSLSTPEFPNAEIREISALLLESQQEIFQRCTEVHSCIGEGQNRSVLLKNDLDRTLASWGELQMEYASLLRQKDETERGALVTEKKLSESNEELLKLLSNSQGENSILTTQYEKSCSRIEELELSLERLNERHQECVEARDNLLDQLDRAQEKVDQLSSQVGNLRDESQQTKVELENTLAALGQLRVDKRQAEELAEKFRVEKERVEKRAESLSVELLERVGNHSDLIHELKNSQNELSSIKVELTEEHRLRELSRVELEKKTEYLSDLEQKYRNVVSEVQSKTAEIGLLEKRLQSDRDAEIRIAQSFESDKRSFEAEIHRITSENESLQKDILRFKEESRSLDAKRKALLEKLEHLQSDFDGRLQQSWNESSELKNRVAELESESDDLRATVANLTTKNNGLEEMYRKLQQDFKRLREHADTTESLNAELRSRLGEAEVSVTVHRDASERYSTEAVSYGSELQKCRDEIVSLRKSLSVLKNADERSRSLEEEKRVLQESVQQSQCLIDELQERIINLESSLGSTKILLSEKSKMCEFTASQCERYRIELQSWQMKASENGSAAQELQSSLEAKESSAVRFQHDLDSTREELTQVLAALKSSELRNESLQKQIVNLEDMVRKLELKLQEIRDDRDRLSSKLFISEEKSLELEERIQETGQLRQNELSDRYRIHEELTHARSQLAQLNASYTQLNERFSSLQQAYEEIEKRNLQLLDEREKHTQTIVELNEKNQRLHERASEIELLRSPDAFIRSLREEIDVHSRRASEMQSELQSLEPALRDLQGVLSLLVRKLQTKDGISFVSEEDANRFMKILRGVDARGELLDTRLQLRLALERNRQLELEIQQSQKRLDEASHQASELRTSLDISQTDVYELRAERNRLEMMFLRKEEETKQLEVALLASRTRSDDLNTLEG